SLSSILEKRRRCHRLVVGSYISGPFSSPSKSVESSPTTPGCPCSLMPSNATNQTTLAMQPHPAGDHHYPGPVEFGTQHRLNQLAVQRTLHRLQSPHWYSDDYSQAT